MAKKKVVEVDPSITLEAAIKGYLDMNAQITALEEKKALFKATIDKAIADNKGQKVETKDGYALRSLCEKSSLDKALIEKVLKVTITDECYKHTAYEQTKVYGFTDEDEATKE